MADEIEKKDVKILLNESWDFFAKRWIILFQVSLFVWIPVMMILPLAAFLWTSYNSIKHNHELLFSIKVMLAGGILSFTVIGLLVLVLLMDKLMKVTIMDKLWEKPEVKYYLEFFKVLKEVWPKMGELFYPQLLVWLIILFECLLLFVPGTFSFIWFFFVPGGDPRLLEWIIVLSGYSLLCAPGVLFLIWFSFVPYEIILRGKPWKEALVSSKKIVRHSLMKFIGNLLVMVGILIFINIGLTGFFKLISSFSNSKVLSGAGEFAATVISNILNLWLTVFHFSLYKELEKRYLSGRNVSATHPEERRDEGSLQV